MLDFGTARIAVQATSTDPQLTASGQPRKSTPGHGGAREGAGRRPGRKPGDGFKADQADAYTLLAKAKAKRETYRAHIAELEYKQKSGDLLPRDEVAAAWIDRVQILKGRLLALPSRVAPIVATAQDMRAIEQALRGEIIAALTELADEAAAAP